MISDNEIDDEHDERNSENNSIEQQGELEHNLFKKLLLWLMKFD